MRKDKDCSKMTRSNARGEGLGCNLQDVRSNGDMQPDKHNTTTAREGQPEQSYTWLPKHLQAAAQ